MSCHVDISVGPMSNAVALGHNWQNRCSLVLIFGSKPIGLVDYHDLRMGTGALACLWVCV